MKKYGWFVLLYLGIVSCNQKDCCITDPNDSYDREALLSSIVNDQLLPSYVNFNSQLKGLNEKAVTFEANPSFTTLTEFKTTYLSVYEDWQKMALFEGGSGSRWGPSATLYLRRYVNTFPTKPIKIEEAILSKDYDLESNFVIQGLPALDYLLYGFDESEVIAQFENQETGPGRMAFLQAILDQMIMKSSALNSTWETYQTSFIENDGTASNSSFAKLLNGLSEYYEQQVRKAKLGGPFGKFTQGVKRPQDIETLYSKQSEKMLSVSNQAVIDFYEGKHFNANQTSTSIKDYLASTEVNAMGTNVLLSDEFSRRLIETQSSIDKINGNYFDLINQDELSLEQAYASFQNVIVLLKVEIFAALGSSISYTDIDGD